MFESLPAFPGVESPGAELSSTNLWNHLWKCPTDYAATRFHRLPRLDIHTFASSVAKSEQNPGLHCAAGGATNIMPTHKDSNKRNRRKLRRKRERKSIQISAKVSPLLYEQIEAIAVAEDRTVASVARYLMSVALELIKTTRSPLLRAENFIRSRGRSTARTKCRQHAVRRGLYRRK